jgi:hypothetical protein
MTVTTNEPPVNAPTKPGEWSLAQIIEALSKPLPGNLLETKKLGGRTIAYIPWHRAVLVLDKYTNVRLCPPPGTPSRWVFALKSPGLNFCGWTLLY